VLLWSILTHVICVAKAALQGSIATHIYALVNDVYKCCMLTTDVSMFKQHICVAVKICHMLSGFAIIIV